MLHGYKAKHSSILVLLQLACCGCCWLLTIIMVGVHDFITKKDTQSPVLVTGADGYVAGVLVRELLQAGCTVHATTVVRQQPREHTAYLQELVADDDAGTKGRLRLFTANLLEPGSFAEAMKGCRLVFHTASPFLLRHGLDPQRDLVDPAVRGTVNVLETARQTPSVRRIVQTSSVGAVYADAMDTYDAPHHILTEEVWNTTSTLSHQPYFLSKTLAERKAWEMAKQQQRWTLVTILPALILGPGVQYHADSESFRTLQKLGGALDYWSLLTGVPDFAMPVVDVRDVAAAHLKAGFDAASVPSGRYIVSASNTSLGEMAKWLRQKYPQYPIPGVISPVPKCIAAWVTPYCRQGIDALTVTRNLNVQICLDNTKSKQILGLEYRDPATTVQEMFQQMVDAGAVQPGPRPELVGLVLLTSLAVAGGGGSGGSVLAAVGTVTRKEWLGASV